MRVMVPERLEEALSVAFETIAQTIRGELPFSSTMHSTMPIIEKSSKSSMCRHLYAISIVKNAASANKRASSPLIGAHQAHLQLCSAIHRTLQGRSS